MLPDWFELLFQIDGEEATDASDTSNYGQSREGSFSNSMTSQQDEVETRKEPM